MYIDILKKMCSLVRVYVIVYFHKLTFGELLVGTQQFTIVTLKVILLTFLYRNLYVMYLNIFVIQYI